MIGFYPYPQNTPDLSRSQAWQFSSRAPQFAAGFHEELAGPATNALSPIKAAITRGAGITAAAGTRLTHHLFSNLCTVGKSILKQRMHSEFLRHACAHCGIFALAAPRRTWTLVSESISGLPLSRPVPVIGLPGSYPSNNLMGRRPILRSAKNHTGTGADVVCANLSRFPCLSRLDPSFPGFSSAAGQVSDVLLSWSPWFNPGLA